MAPVSVWSEIVADRCGVHLPKGAGNGPRPRPICGHRTGQTQLHRRPSRAAARRGLYVRAAGRRRVRVYRVRHRRVRRADRRWECSLSKETAFVERAIRAAALRARQGDPIGGLAIHYSDAGRTTPGKAARIYLRFPVSEGLLQDGLCARSGRVTQVTRGGGRFPAVVRHVNGKRFRNVPGFCCYSSRKPERSRGLGAGGGTDVPAVSSGAPMTGTSFPRILQQRPEHRKSQIYRIG